MLHERVNLKGLRFADIELQDRIGGGGSAAVYLGIERPFHSRSRRVAVKTFVAPIEDREETNRKFEECKRDVSALIQMSNHPAILQYFGTHIVDIVRDASGHATATSHPPQAQDEPLIAFCIVTEFADGGSLGSEYRQTNILGADKKIFISHFLDICDGLKHAHNSGIVHRDIKPANIFWFREHNRVTLGDFGIAKPSDSFVEPQSYLVGSMPYMSPESFDPYITAHQSRDIYALGCTFYELLTGEPPFSPSQTLKIDELRAGYLKMHAESIRPDALGRAKDIVPFQVNHLLKRMMAVLPADRPSIDEVIDVLDKWKNGWRNSIDSKHSEKTSDPILKKGSAQMRSMNLVHPTFRRLINDKLYFLFINLPVRGHQRMDLLLGLLEKHFGAAYSFFEVFGRSDIIVRAWTNRDERILKDFCASAIDQILEQNSESIRIIGCEEVDYLAAKTWKKLPDHLDCTETLIQIYEAQELKTLESIEYLRNIGVYTRDMPPIDPAKSIKSLTLIEGVGERNEHDLKLQYDNLKQSILSFNSSFRSFRIACYRRSRHPVLGEFSFENCDFLVSYVVKRFEDVARVPEAILEKMPNLRCRTSTFLASGRFFLLSDGVKFET